MDTFIHAGTHRNKASKSSGNYVEIDNCCPVSQYWDASAPLRCLSFVTGKFSWGELEVCRNTVQVSWREVTEPTVKFHNDYATKQDKFSRAFASPVYTLGVH